ncbi:hypothetical protein MPTK1_6g18470 [Marchantia polymorpha subsp. ruderalis]|uniref:Uncharacterized protein n=2 Tax=Marchantia polymorpha TaxID=3197 RepID=A0AAF6BTE5_MARPO|nr:hypothetical protein MARPO_0038s0057 [Marchantia polymorpha]BBN15279.1 hypothetical protein Mp_6g18470 [Marchantia polymorpha subsp. ruderalis]|eukprot:PTQ40712.1 hypothetical protein MARPO_0038s0057 [Marchantia polymorpha]
MILVEVLQVLSLYNILGKKRNRLPNTRIGLLGKTGQRLEALVILNVKMFLSEEYFTRNSLSAWRVQ